MDGNGDPNSDACAPPPIGSAMPHQEPVNIPRAIVPPLSLLPIAPSHGTSNASRCMDCNPRNSMKKRSRSAPWTVPEMLTLIDAKKKEREWCQMYKRDVKLPAAERWRLVAAHMESKDMGRTGSQCQDKWENMMKDYKAVRDWQCVGPIGPTRNYFKQMNNKERKDANLPPQMDEIVFYSLHAIQSEKEEKRELERMQKSEGYMKSLPLPLRLPLAPLPLALPMPGSGLGLGSGSGSGSGSAPVSVPSSPRCEEIIVAPPVQINDAAPMPKDKEGSSEEADLNSIDTDSSGKKKMRKIMEVQGTAGFDSNPEVFDNFVQAYKDGSKEFVDCFMKALERSENEQNLQEPADVKKIKTRENALLTRALVALADAVKMVAQKL